MKERRKDQRYNIPYHVEGDAIDPETEETLKDVSKNGIAFICKSVLGKEDIVDVKIFLKGRMFYLKARVVHIKGDKKNRRVVGAKFIDPPREFEAVFEEEIEDIKQLKRELNLHKNKDYSFKKVSREYLGTL